MDIQKIVILNPSNQYFCSVSANVETMHMVINGERIKIHEVNKPSHKFEVCFVKDNKSRLYP
nr:MAG TPA: hypothetical protein [Caudoviricetes sp.]